MAPQGANLDRRRHAYRDDLADKVLEGRVQAARFVEGEAWHVAAAKTPVFPAPRADGDRDTEALSGEAVTVFEVREGWAWGQLARDRYVGYLAEADLARGNPPAATHVVTSPQALVYAAPTARAPVVETRYFTSRVAACAEADGFIEVASGGFIGRPHVAPLTESDPDIVATAQKVLHAPYLWGGKTVAGVDCSGLIQLCLDRAGIDCPRDTDMQQADLPGDLEIGPEALPHLERGDLVYWSGHVAMMIDAMRAIHATAHVMSVTIEPILDIAARARGDGPIATAVKRLSLTLA
jgi:cell wall-associated NlpC family hydrolase